MKNICFQMMNRKTLVVMLLSLCMSLPALAQKITVQGTVFDETGETLIGASVIVKGTSVGVATDFDGNFRVEAAPDAVLSVSYVGYIPQEVKVDGRTEIKITLKPNSAVLDEVVAIGYGTVKKDDATGSVSTIKPSEIQAGLATSVQDLLVGQTPGVVVTTSGGPEGKGNILIRGGASLKASNDPLIILDGVPLSSGGVDGMGNPLSMIAPDNIENMTVLKDASATAIYGSRASNGVIIITTKKGKSGKPQVSFTANMYVNTARKTWDVLNADEYRAIMTEYHGAESDAVKAMGNTNTNWQDEILRTTVSSDYSLSVGGTAGFLPYRVSASYTNNNGILDTSRMDRLTFGFKLTPEFFDGKLKVQASADGYYIKNQFADEGAIGTALSSDPTRSIYNDWETVATNLYGKNAGWTLYNGYNVWTSAGVLNSNSNMNAVSMLKDRDNYANVWRSTGKLNLDYALHFLPELRLNLTMGYDVSNSKGHNIVAFNSPLSFKNAYNDGSATDYYYFARKLNTSLEFYANYNKDFEVIKSNVDVTAGYSWQRETANGHNNGTKFLSHGFNVITQNADGSYNLNANIASEGRVGKSYSDPYRWDNGNLQLISFFGRLNYSLLDRYLLTFTMRSDATSRFAEDNRWGTFPSVALAWKILDEPWLKGLKGVMNEWKLRLSWGITGQQAVGGYFDYLATYLESQPQSQYPSIKDGKYTNTLYPQGYNRNLKWEETTTWNAGFDFGFLNNRITASVDYYIRESKDLLSTIDVPAGTATTNRMVMNFGSLENRGVEFNITARPIVNKDLTWTVNYNVAYNKNEITKLNNDGSYVYADGSGISGGTGNSVQVHKVGYPAYSFLLFEQVYDAEGNPIEGEFVDQNGDGEINDDDLRIRYSKDPKVTMTFGSTVNWKNWDFGINMRANLGNYVYNNVLSNNSTLNSTFKNAQLSNLVKTDVYFTGDVNPNRNLYLSDYWLENASFLRCDNITVGYTFKDLAKNFSRLRVYGAVQNPFVITNYSGLDPEVFGGVDNNVYPRATTFTLGVVANF